MRLQITGQIAYPKIDLKKFSKTLKQKLEREQNESVKAWFVAVISKIPVYTGTAKGTFKPLGRYLNEKVDISPVNTTKKYFEYGGIKYPLGFKLAGKYTTYKFTQKNILGGMEYRFLFINMLPYFVWNDMQPGPTWFPFKIPPPYKALDAGEKAWRDYVLNILPKKLPKYANHVTIVKSRIR
jgi:hypothetical protein